MKIIGTLSAGIILLSSSIALAQELTPGKYSGSYKNNAGTVTSIGLDIKSVENGVVKGVGTWTTTARGGGQCRGEYPFTGALKDARLSVRGDAKGGPAGDCDFAVGATVEGGQLKAKVGQNEFTMSR